MARRSRSAGQAAADVSADRRPCVVLNTSSGEHIRAPQASSLAWPRLSATVSAARLMAAAMISVVGVQIRCVTEGGHKLTNTPAEDTAAVERP